MLFLISGFVLVLAYVLTPIVVALSWRIGAVDIPEDWRRMHNESIPRGGGLAIVLPFFLGCALLGNVSGYLGAVLYGGGLMLAVGLVDDVFCLGPRVKLLLQLATAGTAVLMGGVASGWSVVLAVLWVVTLTNAHNFIDGMDGLLCGCVGIESLLLSGTLFLCGRGDSAAVAVLLAVACFGFRPYNRHPARVFAGDCGSETLGFLLGMLSLPLFFGGTVTLGRLSPFFLFAYPLGDMAAAILRRVLRGRSPLSADRGHLHHRLYAAGLSVPECVGILLGVSGVLGTVGLLLSLETLWIYASASGMAAVVIFSAVRKYVMRGGYVDRG